MRSFLIVEVEHGETTDPLQALSDDLFPPGQPLNRDYFGDMSALVLDTTVVVDLPPFIDAINVAALLRP